MQAMERAETRVQGEPITVQGEPISFERELSQMLNSSPYAGFLKSLAYRYASALTPTEVLESAWVREVTSTRIELELVACDYAAIGHRQKPSVRRQCKTTFRRGTT